MDVIGIILVLIVLALLVAALLGQLAWSQALLFCGIVGLVALVVYLILPRLRKPS